MYFKDAISTESYDKLKEKFRQKRLAKKLPELELLTASFNESPLKKDFPYLDTSSAHPFAGAQVGDEVNYRSLDGKDSGTAIFKGIAKSEDGTSFIVILKQGNRFKFGKFVILK